MNKIKYSSLYLSLLTLSSIVFCQSPALAGPQAKVEKKAPSQTQAQTPQNTVKSLQHLSQAEIDASFLLTQAIENASNRILKDELLKIKMQTEENIKTIAGLIHGLGGEAPSYSRDFKGFFMQGYAAMRGALNDQGVMVALHNNLKKILEIYESELNGHNLPDDIKTKIREIYEIKRKHLNYVASQL